MLVTAYDRTHIRATRRQAAGLWLLLMICLVAGCQRQPSAGTSALIRVTTTTTMVTDLVRNVGGEWVEVQGLMGPGVDPHLYKASASDVARLQNADVIFYSGLMLEGQMQEMFERLAQQGRHVYPVTRLIPEEKLLTPPEFKGHHDPHVWFDVPLWSRCIEPVAQALSEIDPTHAQEYRSRGRELEARWRELHEWARKRTAQLPSERRILITSHDAFNYFGRSYGFKVVGLQGISTVTEAGTADMSKMVEFIVQNQVRAIFVESSVPHNTIERISRDAGVKIGGELFSDAMGTPGKVEHDYDLGTYEGMIKHNINTVVEALQ